MNDWSIVVAGDATASERYAAEEFQSLFRQLTGVALPITGEVPARSKNIFIGAGAAAAAGPSGFDADGMGEESLRIRVLGENVVVAGGRPRGTLYGVYEFFERYCGVRFLTADQTHFPAVSQVPPWRTKLVSSSARQAARRSA